MRLLSILAGKGLKSNTQDAIACEVLELAAMGMLRTCSDRGLPDIGVQGPIIPHLTAGSVTGMSRW